jgi:hypothetical protein
MLLLVAGFIRLDRAVTRHIHETRVGPTHSFALGSTPAHLGDEVALAKAREAMALDGFDPSVWKPVPDDRTAAPDGTRDQWLSRGGDANGGTIRFFDETGKAANPGRIVDVVLVGDHVECRVIEPK